MDKISGVRKCVCLGLAIVFLMSSASVVVGESLNDTIHLKMPSMISEDGQDSIIDVNSAGNFETKKSTDILNIPPINSNYLNSGPDYQIVTNKNGFGMLGTLPKTEVNSQQPIIDLDFDDDRAAPNQVIVGFSKDLSSVDLNALISKHGGRIINSNELLNFIVIETPDNDIRSYMMEISDEPDIDYIEPNKFVEPAFVPNDEYYDEFQWGPKRINSELAWEVTQGDSNIIIAILDTGIDYNHPDLNGNLWTNPGEIPNNGNDDDGNGYEDDYYGIDFVPPFPWSYDGDPLDDNGHGTHCAGVAAAEIQNGEGVAGLSQSKIMSIKILDSGGHFGWFGLSSNVADGITYVINEKVAENNPSSKYIISMSLSSLHSTTLENAVNTASSNGILMVAATGNDNDNEIAYPARYSNVIAVGATNENNQRCTPADWGNSGFPLYLDRGSNYGPELELMAPGDGILSTYPTYLSSLGYAYDSGTSMATPHVAGAAALLWSHEPSLTNNEVRARLVNTALDLDTPGWDLETGYGLLDIGKAITSDLIVESIWTSPSSPVGGQSATIYARIKNNGYSITTGSFNVKLFIDGSQNQLWSTGTLNPGSYVDLQKTVTLTEGIHVLRVAADTSTDIPECNENNNELITSKTWSGPSSITISETLNPSSCFPLDQIEVYGVATFNTGSPVTYADVDITVSGSTWVTTTDSTGYYSHYISAPGSSGSYSVGVSIIASSNSGSNSKILSVQNTGDSSQYDVESIITCKDVGASSPYNPIDETQFFRSSDEKSVTLIHLTDIYSSLGVQWRWYDPEGDQYSSLTSSIPSPPLGQYWIWYKTWAWIWIDGYTPEDFEGAWETKVYIDDGGGYEVIDTVGFTIRYEAVQREMCKDVQASSPYEPINPTDTFYNTDSRAYAWIRLDDVAEGLDLEWRWYGPTGSLYLTSPYTVPDPGAGMYYPWYKFWSWIDIDGAPPQTMFGQWKVDALIKDVYGNWDIEYSQYFTIIDNTGPGVPGTPTDGGIYCTTDTVTWSWTSASEDDSVSQYQIQVGTFPGSNNFYDDYVQGEQLSKTLSGFGEGETYYARVRAMNRVGQWGGWSGNSDGITIDSFPPSTSISLSGTLGNNGIYASDVTTTLSPNDQTSGVSDTYYRVNGASWQNYVGAFLISGDGSYIIEYYSTDYAGNTEVIKQELVIIDTTQPIVLSTSPLNGATDVALNQDIIVTFSEPMNTSLVTYSCSPNPGGWSVIWSAGDTVATFSHFDFFEFFELHTFEITGGTDIAGNPLVAGAVPNPWSWSLRTSFQRDGIAYDGVGVLDTALIVAWIDGVEYGRTVTSMLGEFSITIDADGALPDNVKTGGYLGDTIVYTWGDLTGATGEFFIETDIWTVGGSVLGDLNIGAPVNLLKIATVSQYSDYVALYNPTGGAVDASGYMLAVGNGAPGPIIIYPGLGSYNLNPIPAGDLLFCSLTTGVANSIQLYYGSNIVDRVEFGAIGTEPENTVMSNAVSPGAGQEIYRMPTFFTDTNDCAVDFAVRVEDFPTLTTIVITTDPVIITSFFVGTVAVSVQGYDQYGNPMACAPVWSDNSVGTTFINVVPGSPATADLSTDGSQISGVFTITAFDGAIMDTAILSITGPSLTSIVITPDPVSLDVSTTIGLTAQGYDQFGTPMACSPVWADLAGGGSFSNIVPGSPATADYTAGAISGTWINSITATDGLVIGMADLTITDDLYEFSLNLDPGWNLISIPLILDNTSLDYIFGANLTGGTTQGESDKIFKWDAVNEKWLVAYMWEDGGPFDGTWLFVGDDFTIEPDVGYWVWIRDDLGHPSALIDLTGEDPGERNVPISVGWNLVGYTSLTPITLQNGDIDTSGLYDSGFTGGLNQGESDRVYNWNGAGWQAPQYMWEDISAPTWDGTWLGLTSFDLAPGKGYWIEVRETHTGFTWTYGG